MNQFDDSQNKVGLFTFGTSTQVNVPMATSFKTKITNTIDSQIVPNSASTNAPQGLWLGDGERIAEPDSSPLNVIVFFTDDQPSSYTASFPVRTAACPGNSWAHTAAAPRRRPRSAPTSREETSKRLPVSGSPRPRAHPPQPGIALA